MRLLRWLALIAVLGYLMTGVTQVGTGERAAVRRFGRFVGPWGPGLHVGLPYGMDRVDRVAVAAVRQVSVGYRGKRDEPGETPPGQFLTGDQNLIDVRVTVEYAVDPSPGGLENFVLQRDRADGLIARTAEALMTEWAASRPVDATLRGGESALPMWLTRRLPARLEGYRLGVQVRQVSVAYLSPPEDVRPDFEAVNRAMTAMRTAENEAERWAEGRKTSAEVEAAKALSAAAAYRDGQLLRAEADKAAFLQRLGQYRRLRQSNPNVLAAIWWDEVGGVLGKMRRGGRIDLLDSRLGPDGLDITQFLPPGRDR